MTQTNPIVTQGDAGINIASFRRFLDMEVAANRKSPSTRKTYLEACHLFARHLSDMGMPQDVANIKREHVESFVNWQVARWKPYTAVNRLGGVKAFFKFLVEEGEVKADADPTAKVKPPRSPEEPVQFLRQDEIQAIVDTCKGTDFEARRDRAILLLYATTGGRRSEVANIRYVPDDPERNDVGLDEGVIRVKQKMGRFNLLPLQPIVVHALDRYLRVRAKQPQAHIEWLWLGRRGRLTEDGIRQMLERRVKQAGIGRHVHPHMFRHSAAHYLLSDGAQESDVMRLMGWRDPSMLRRYASSAANERAHAASRKFGLGTRLR